MTCNSSLEVKSADQVRDIISSDIVHLFNEFFYCKYCNKVFWKGSHFKHMETQIIKIIHTT